MNDSSLPVLLSGNISPRFSEESRPLRDVLSELHEKRSKGIKGTKSKFLPKQPAVPLENAPEWWGTGQEKAFLKIKDMVKHAVLLNSPDLEGAANGTNVLHLFVDACGYGIGAGLFQSHSKEQTDEKNFYQVLGIDSWATTVMRSSEPQVEGIQN